MSVIEPCYYVIERNNQFLWVGHTFDLQYQTGLHKAYEKFSDDYLHRNLKGTQWKAHWLSKAKMKCNQDDINYFVYLLYREKMRPLNIFFGDDRQRRKYDVARLLAKKEELNKDSFLRELENRTNEVERHLGNAKYYLKKRLEVIKNREKTYVEMEE